MLKDYVAFLRAEIQRYESLVDSILLQIKAITELLRLPEKTGGIYIKPFEGEGGNRFFLSDLATSLAQGYPNAPPFHRGDEYVMGVVLMMGGPKPQVETNFSLLKSILVTGTDKAESLVDTLGEAISDLEEAAFGQDFNEEEVEQPMFDESLSPLVLCTIPAPVELEFNPDFTPVET